MNTVSHPTNRMFQRTACDERMESVQSAVGTIYYGAA